MTAALLLDRLDRVRQTGPGRWIACCPAHDDKSPSLSIRETEDGRILLHDFAGCDVHSVLSAFGMSLSDLFPDRLERHVKPACSRVPLRDLVAMLDHEALVIYVAGSDLLEKKTIDAEDWQRLKKAVCRVGEVRDELT